MIVAGGDRLAEPPLDPALLATVAEATERAARVASVCTGAFVLADPADDHSLPAMAARAAVSPRHLTGLFHAERVSDAVRHDGHDRAKRFRGLRTDP